MIDRQSKSLDIALENFRQAIRTVEIALTISLTCVVILVTWGLQGEFERDAKARIAAHRDSSASGLASQGISLPSRIDVEVPILGFKADLETAGVLGLILYMVFTFRAANHVQKSAKIAKFVLTIDSSLDDALLSSPSAVTGSKKSQVFLAISLGGLAAAGNYLYSATAIDATGLSPWGNTILVLVPAVYLGTQLLNWRSNAGLVAGAA